MNTIKEVYNLYARMALNSDSMIDTDFSKSIKFTVDEYIGDEVPTVHFCNSFHDMILLAYKFYLQGKLHSVGIYDRYKNYNGTTALEKWLDEPLKETNRLKQYELNENLERLDNLEKLVKHYKISNDIIEEVNKIEG